MHRHRFAGPGALLAVALASSWGCADVPTVAAPESEDGVFTSLQTRGEQVTADGEWNHGEDHGAWDHGEDHAARDHSKHHGAWDHGEDHP